MPRLHLFSGSAIHPRACELLQHAAGLGPEALCKPGLDGLASWGATVLLVPPKKASIPTERGISAVIWGTLEVQAVEDISGS